MLIRPELELPPPRVGELRIRDLLSHATNPAAIIVGFPSDAGVALNGGRVGSADAPGAIRSALYRLTPGSHDMEVFWRHTVDLGDVRCTGHVEADQNALADVLSPYLRQNVVCIVLGGGHETAFGHFLGHARAAGSVEILNVDAHADVRELVDGQGHSGSPFRQALEHPEHPARAYTVFGLAPQSTPRSLVEYLDRHPTKRIWNHEANTDLFDEIIGERADTLMVSFDVDAFDESVAPGVSAPNAEGLSRQFGYRAAYSAGVSPRVMSFEVSEMNPRFDVGNRTARFAAMLVWHFVEGLATRQELRRFLKT